MANQAQDRTKRLYGLQWNRYRIVRSEEDEATLKLKTGLTQSEFAGITVLDGGCGMGRYARVAASWGASVLGMDLSETLEKVDEFKKSHGAISF